MIKRFIIPMLLFSTLVGCASSQHIYVDGMPISNHEYVANISEGFKTSFILTRYYEKRFGNETMTYPEYMDIWDNKNEIDASKTKDLILHIKVVNIKRIPLAVWSAIDSVEEKSNLILYKGRLPRKDLMLRLPIAKNGKTKFEVVINGDKEELFRIWGEYKTEGGER